MSAKWISKPHNYYQIYNVVIFSTISKGWTWNIHFSLPLYSSQCYQTENSSISCHAYVNLNIISTHTHHQLASYPNPWVPWDLLIVLYKLIIRCCTKIISLQSRLHSICAYNQPACSVMESKTIKQIKMLMRIWPILDHWNTQMDSHEGSFQRPPIKMQTLKL